jgi:phosphatidylserine/phosphatidylglycerophosphate/cardiolipin synthase-like enzyme
VPDPAKWFLPFAPNGDGLPWGDGTAIAKRLDDGLDPWDTGCKVTPLIGGYATMKAIRDALEQTITDASASPKPPGERGHVYITGWRFNCLRDLDANNNTTWTSIPPVDQTALGLVLRLMGAGIQVRIMVWLPSFLGMKIAGLAHIEDHFYLAHAVRQRSQELSLGTTEPRGLVALDMRTADGTIAGSHHQKAIVIRGPNDDVAFCGGVDFAFTRRDAPNALPVPAGPAFLDGDWQSGPNIPDWSFVPTGWPTGVPPPSSKQETDVPPADKGGAKVYGDKQIWHDQHLMLRGPIVQTLEQQFGERWRDTGRLFDLSNDANDRSGQVIFSSSAAYDLNGIKKLPDAKPARPSGGTSPVQMWRTIPWRDSRTGPPFKRAEFTAMAGVSRAVAQSEHLIWIFDQYFWSVALARQLNAQLLAKSDLHVILILPPYADSNDTGAYQHDGRNRALEALHQGIPPSPARIAVYNLWDPRTPPLRGIYCHAKVQTYDGGLVVCGSVNMNRRSFLCDSELACAVADEAVVKAYQQQLWTLLFRDVTGTKGQWPAPTFTGPTSGAQFFAAFVAAAGEYNAYLRKDPWPGHILWNQAQVPSRGVASSMALERLVDPTSVDPWFIERVVDEPGANPPITRPARLDDVVRRIEKSTNIGAAMKMPNRRQVPLCRRSLEEVDPNYPDGKL